MPSAGDQSVMSCLPESLGYSQGGDGDSGFLPRPKFRRRILYVAEAGMYWTGMGSAYVMAKGVGGAIILTYHSVPPRGSQRWIDPRNSMRPEVFEAQMRFLSRNRRVVSINALVAMIRTERYICPGTVVLTFDDGYRDNLEIVAPILEEYHFPATLYLATGYVNRAESQWVDRLFTMFRSRTRHSIQVGLPDRGTFDLREPSACRKAYSLIHDQLLARTHSGREELLGFVKEHLKPEYSAPRLTLTWEEIRILRRHYPLFDIGVHTSDHIDLTACCGEVAQLELRRSLEDVERELGRRADHFSFPYSRHNRETRSIVKQFGLCSALASGADCLINRSSDPYALPRINPPRSMSLFRFWTSGAYPGLPIRLLSRA